MNDRVQDPVECRAFDRFVYAYQGGELSEPDARKIRDHAEACPSCARRLQVEASFLRGLQGRLERVPAPPGLETRIRAALRAQAPDAGRGFRSWLGTPWFAATAAAVLLVGLLVGLPELRSPVGASSTASFAVRHEGTIVDYDCDRSGIPVALQRDCDHPMHLNALRLADDSYVHFSLEGETARALTGDRTLRGAVVAVSGEYYPEIRTVKVERFERLRAAETAAWRPLAPDGVH
jgi:hypothetical protein